MNLKIRMLNDLAVIPQQMTSGAAALDLVATSKEWDEVNQALIFGTGLAVEIPCGHVGLLFPRSSVFKTGLSLANSVGVIDSDYRGEIKAVFYPGHRAKKNYEVGDRVVQLMILPIPAINIQVVDELSSTNRGEGGLGSTGN